MSCNGVGPVVLVANESVTGPKVPSENVVPPTVHGLSGEPAGAEIIVALYDAPAGIAELD